MCSSKELGSKIDNLVSVLGATNQKLDQTNHKLEATNINVARLESGLETWQKTKCAAHDRAIDVLEKRQGVISAIAGAASATSKVFAGITLLILASLVGLTIYLVQVNVGA